MAIRGLIFGAAAIVAGTAGFLAVRGVAAAELRPPRFQPGTETTRGGIASSEARSTSPTPGKNDRQASEKESLSPPKLSLFSLLLPVLDDDRLHMAISSTLNSGLHVRILDLLLTSEDPELLRLCGHFLLGVNSENKDLIHRIADCFEAERQPDRRRALANALSFQADNDRARSLAHRILTEGQTDLMEEVLNGFELSDVPEEEFAPWRNRLQAVALGGATPRLRARALSALWGDSSAEGIRFMLERLSKASEPEEQCEAADSISCWPWGDGAALAPEAAASLLSLVLNPAVDRRVRRSAAFRIESIAEDFPEIQLTPAEKEVVGQMKERIRK